MRTSIAITNFSWPDAIDAQLAAVAQIADDGGIDTLFVADHLQQAEPGAEPSEPMLEAFTTLAHLAARTERVRLGTMVASVMFRAPALLVKAVTTLDVLSGGRAWLGVGAGYQLPELDDMGVALPPTSERFDWLEDTLQLAQRLWAADDSTFTGRRVNAMRPVASPPPCTKPHPPILVGGWGEQRTLRLVARYADACNLPDVPDGGKLIRRKLEVLADHCTREGRAFDEIEKTVSTRFTPGEQPEDVIERARVLGALGMDHLVVLTRGPWTTDHAAALVRAVPAIEEIQQMPILDHTIVASHDNKRAAAFLTEILGLPEPETLGHFEVVPVGEVTTLDFLTVDRPVNSQHYAFLVTEEEFDEIFARIRARDLPFWSDPGHGDPGQINTWDGGRGVYFDDPDGHNLEILTRPYGTGGSTTDHPHPLVSS